MEKQIRYFFRVFSEREHAESFMNGKIRFGKLGYYQAIECIRGDNRENITGNLDPSRYTLTLKAEEHVLEIRPEDMAGPLQIRHNYLNSHYIYCLSSFKDDKSKGIFILPERGRLEKFGKHIVIIKPKPFIERLSKVIVEKEERYHLSHGVIKYKDFNEDFFTLKDEERGFIKDKSYEDENEYRFKLALEKTKEDFITYDIGNLNDIAYLGEFKDFSIKGEDWEW